MNFASFCPVALLGGGVPEPTPCALIIRLQHPLEPVRRPDAMPVSGMSPAEEAEWRKALVDGLGLTVGIFQDVLTTIKALPTTADKNDGTGPQDYKDVAARPETVYEAGFAPPVLAAFGPENIATLGSHVTLVFSEPIEVEEDDGGDDIDYTVADSDDDTVYD